MIFQVFLKRIYYGYHFNKNVLLNFVSERDIESRVVPIGYSVVHHKGYRLKHRQYRLIPNKGYRDKPRGNIIVPRGTDLYLGST